MGFKCMPTLSFISVFWQVFTIHNSKGCRRMSDHFRIFTVVGNKDSADFN